MQTQETHTKKNISVESVRELVGHCKIEGHNHSTRCVDGRYPQDTSLPECSEPGADAGRIIYTLGALLALDIEVNQEVVDRVVEAVAKTVGGVSNIHFHTDDHHQGEIAGGCGHVEGAIKNPETYGLTVKVAELIKKVLEHLKAQGAKEDVLHGTHEEEAVLVVNGDHGLISQYAEHQVFVYQSAMANDALVELAKTLAPYFGVEELVLVEKMGEVAKKQLKETLGRVAKGLPMFEVAPDGQVTEKGRV